jgi:hypothetical protein
MVQDSEVQRLGNRHHQWPEKFTRLEEGDRSNRKKTLSWEFIKSECRIMNFECRRNVFYLFYKKMTERSDSILRHSIFDILRFCGSLFNFVKFHTRFGSVRITLNVEPRTFEP